MQPDLCQACLETTWLVFPRGGSFYAAHLTILHTSSGCLRTLCISAYLSDKREGYTCDHCGAGGMEYSDLDDLIAHHDNKHADLPISYTDLNADGTVNHILTHI